MPASAPLTVQDSLHRRRVPFAPAHAGRVTWYQCGPTVYAESHLGHARSVEQARSLCSNSADSKSRGRTYVSQDVLRRILRDYFGYHIRFVMNVTDIDDKVRSSTTRDLLWAIPTRRRGWRRSSCARGSHT